MGWRQRVQKIAETNPEKLHPMFRSDGKATPKEACWDRADWQDTPEQGGRPIQLVLQWLGAKSLLTPAGEAELAKAESKDYATLKLAPSHVQSTAAAFLTQHYYEWYSTVGINYGIDPNIQFDATGLDQLWDGFIASNNG